MEKQPVPWVTIALAVANVAIFGWELYAGAGAFHPDAQWMLSHGGNFGPITLDGEQWRLLTSMFLHYGLLHLVMNMVGLLDGGRHVERMYGHAGFAALYLVAGLAGSLATSLRANAVSAGASGAIFGVFGAYGAFLLLHRDRLSAEQVSKQARGLAIFLAYNIWFGLSAKGIDMVAHLGGLAAGFAAGLALELGRTDGRSRLRRSLLIGVLGSALVVGVALIARPPFNAMISFAGVEDRVLGRWNVVIAQVQVGAISEDKVADIIERELLPPWREAHAMFDKRGEGELRADMLEYMSAREDGWENLLAGLRANDQQRVEQGLKRQADADAVIARIKQKTGEQD